MLNCHLRLAYFTNEDQSLHLAQRSDRGWLPLAHDLKVPLRDPFVARGPDGRWLLTFTESWTGGRLGIAASSDLARWDPPTYPTVLPGARNCWAPEFLCTPTGILYFWSSTVDRHQAIWACWSLQAPFLLFDPGYPVIDATIRPLGDRWEMAFKDERPEYKAIRTATSALLTGPYGEVSPLLTPTDSEGPIFWGGGLVYDSYRANRWGTTGKALPAPPAARHGSIIR